MDKDEEKLDWIKEYEGLCWNDAERAVDLIERADDKNLIEWLSEDDNIQKGSIKTSEGEFLILSMHLPASPSFAFILRIRDYRGGSLRPLTSFNYIISANENNEIWEKAAKLYRKVRGELLNKVVRTHDEPHTNRCDLGCGGHSGPGRS